MHITSNLSYPCTILTFLSTCILLFFALSFFLLLFLHSYKLHCLLRYYVAFILSILHGQYAAFVLSMFYHFSLPTCMYITLHSFYPCVPVLHFPTCMNIFPLILYYVFRLSHISSWSIENYFYLVYQVFMLHILSCSNVIYRYLVSWLNKHTFFAKACPFFFIYTNAFPSYYTNIIIFFSLNFIISNIPDLSRLYFSSMWINSCDFVHIPCISHLHFFNLPKII